MTRTIDLIVKKREGKALSADEIGYLIKGCVTDRIPDYQIAAWLMAVFFRGMSFVELAALTRAMADSGERYDLTAIPRKKVDKHSTGGVGDKVSLILAPLVASAGVPVPMVSGRSLGHTGGTLDKLESIAGFQVHLDQKTFRRQLGRIGVVMAGQSESLVPADRKLYALRDVTGTVESIPLIAASIMSKKIAAGVEALVMDVKTGSGAFMANPEDARRLAETLVAVGREVGMPVVALLTDMNQPLGYAVGNAVEVAESVETLKGGGPKDLRELVLALGAEMLVLGEAASSVDAARTRLVDCLDRGKALEKFSELVEAQGGDPRIIDTPSRLGLDTTSTEVILADRDGFVSGFDTRQIGIASMVLGGGRQTVDETIDHVVGLRIEKKIGEHVSASEPICRILYRDKNKMEQARTILRNCFKISDGPVQSPQLIKTRLDAAKVGNQPE